LTFEPIDDAAVEVEQAGAVNYRTRIVDDVAGIGAARWDALLAHAPANPFVRHAFLRALHATDCASAATGWEPCHLTLWHGDDLKAAAPLYRKAHSYGEYVFDWAWADAHQRHGVEYYPKWLVAVPFTPVPGPRLLAADTAAREALATALHEHAVESGLSSLHILFLPEADARRFAALGQMTRRSVQFHWFNRGYATFEDYLGALTQPKRKKVRAERRKVAEAGVTFERKVGADITEADWAFFARCYARTYAAHHSTPYLSRAFFWNWRARCRRRCCSSSHATAAGRWPRRSLSSTTRASTDATGAPSKRCPSCTSRRATTR
jgi:uncharacterized protein